MYIVILGAGEVGYSLAKILCYEKHDVVLVEQSEDRLKRAKDSLDIKVIGGSASSYRVLEDAGIKSADMMVAVTNVDEVNLVACMIANQYRVPKKIVRVKNREFATSAAPLNAETLNIDLIIHPESEVAEAVVKLLKQTAATDIVEFEGGRLIMIGIKLDNKCQILEQSLAQVSDSYAELSFRTVAIQRRDRTIIPHGSDIFMNGDRVYVTSKRESLPEILRLTGKENVKMENVMILGGGQTGAEIARTLEAELNVKIIESNADKTEILADKLEKSLVIRGDGRDLNLLALEGIIDMDAFISVTGDDETNIISCLMAKHLQVPRIISLINKSDYTPIIPTIGIDAYVSKQFVTVDNILKFIRRGSIVSVASIPGISAEIIEFLTHKDAKICKKALKDTHLPKGAILGAVVRGEDIFIPVGTTKIQEGDRVVVIALPPAIREVEKLFN